MPRFVLFIICQLYFYPFQVILKGCGGQSAGAYSQSTGIDVIRKHVAEYIQRRDGGIASDPENIILSGGASESIRNVLKLFIQRAGQGKKTGIMIPIPQYPLYSATIEEFGLGQVRKFYFYFQCFHKFETP